MDIKRSELQQQLFVVLSSEISVDSIDENDSSKKNLDLLDIDFNLWTNEENDHLLRVIFTISGAQRQGNIPGLKFKVQAGCDFEIDRSLHSESAEFISLAKFSSVGITYNNIRAYLQSVSSYYPVPVYILPTIDINDLWDKKDNPSPQKTIEKKRRVTNVR